MEKYAIIVAGGSGQRMGQKQPKQFLEIHGKPLIWYTVRAFLEAYDDMVVILVLPEAYLTTGHELFGDELHAGRLQTVKGGNNRFQSVKNGLTHVPTASTVFVHDGVRCLVTTALIQRCFEATISSGSAVPAIEPPDSIRLINNVTGDQNSSVLDRSRIRLIQTPQTFPAAVLQEAFTQPYHEKFSDEATVVETAGFTVNLVEGERSNIKVTYPIDLLIAEQLLRRR